MFVGREEELRVLDEALGGALVGRGSVWLISGEPGIGKTTLADEIGSRASARGALVAWGGAWDGGGAPAYWPWIQVIRGIRSHVPDPAERLRRDLGPLWDEWELRDAVDEGAQDPEVLRFRRHDALRTLLAVASSRAPLVVVLDDVHAADRASLTALHFVARAVRALPMLVLATHRDAEPRLDPAVGDVLARVAREGRTLSLGRLSRAHVARWMAELDGVPARLVDEVHARTGGNPLFVGETLRVVRSGGQTEDVPDGVAAIIRERLARFDEGARDVLAAASVLGREVAWSVLAEVCGATVTAVRERLREATLAGVVEDVRGERVVFVHALFREALMRELGHSDRAKLSLAAGRALVRARAAGGDAPEETIASHLLAALPEGDASEAIEWALRAGERAMRELAFDRAASLLDGARAALERMDAPAGRRIDVELSLAEALARSGQADRGRALCVAAADRARAMGDGVRLARAALVYGAELRISVVDAQLVGLLEEALRITDEQETALRARVLARLAAAQQPSPTPEVPMRRAREAIALSRTLGDAATLLETLYTAGSALVDYAPPEERLPLAKELVALATPRGDLTRAQQGHARATIDCLELCDVGGADLAIAAHVRLGEALGHPRWRWRGALMRAMRAMMHGRWGEAEAAHEEVLALAPIADDANLLPTLAFSRLGLLRARQSGSAQDIARVWDSALDGLEQAGIVGPLVRASTLARLGEVAAVRSVLAPLPADHPVYAADQAALMSLAEAAMATRDPERIAWLLPRLESRSGRVSTWGVFGLVWEGPVAQWLGPALAAVGRIEEAVGVLEEALAMSEAMETRPLTARVATELAAVRIARGSRGDREVARKLVDTAAEIADALGMTAAARRAEVVRAQLDVGAGGARATTTGEEPRTPVRDPSGGGNAPGDPVEVFTMRRQGDVWQVEHAGRSTFLKHSRAVEILDELVRNPGREVHVLDLGSVEAGQVIDAGDAGELLDATAKAAYRKRILEVRAELEQAAAWADTGRRDRLQTELELLTDELSRGVGLGGRERRAAGAVERARVNVQKRLRGVVRKIAEELPELGKHLEGALRTGTFVSYRGA
ncbi:MAG: AAA family ATPase, partial [Deltaproteobacteria bacterium]|nr:AAA family ATPase [Deltaproteobacteria bacterium]